MMICKITSAVTLTVSNYDINFAGSAGINTYNFEKTVSEIVMSHTLSLFGASQTFQSVLQATAARLQMSLKIPAS